MSDQVANCAKTIVDGLYSAADVSITVLDPARFPTAPFTVLWWNATDYGDPSDDPDREFVRVTSVVDDVFTVTRAQEGTSATGKNKTNKVYKMVAGITALMWNSLVASSPSILARVFLVVGSPEGATTADPGTFAWDTSGSALYFKESGTGNTGWQAV